MYMLINLPVMLINIRVKSFGPNYITPALKIYWKLLDKNDALKSFITLHSSHLIMYTILGKSPYRLKTCSSMIHNWLHKFNLSYLYMYLSTPNGLPLFALHL